MTRLVGWFCNQVDRLGCAAATEADVLGLDAGGADGWGVGSYHTGEVLLRKKPIEPRAAVPLSEIVRELRASCALVHVRRATRGARTLDNTHPFRFRQWLFAQTGSLPDFATHEAALRGLVPEFLRRDIRGQTDSEVVFHIVLAALWETGRLDDPELDRLTLVHALRTGLARVDGVLGVPARFNAMITHGGALVAMRRGLPMAWVRRQGVGDCPACRRGTPAADEALRYVMVASGAEVTGPGWRALPDDPDGGPTFLAIDRSVDALVQSPL
jgi:predicted glutamine amidotransferase